MPDQTRTLATSAAGPALPGLVTGQTLALGTDVVARFRSMASDVSIRVIRPNRSAQAAIRRAQVVFENVEHACTRFDSSSALMQANTRPLLWHDVPRELFDAVRAAYDAYVLSDGLFDPRILRTLVDLGYDRSLPFGPGVVVRPAADRRPAPPEGPWQPAFDERGGAIRLGSDPIDLGGIGKGLAVRWASACLKAAGTAVLVEAGGDCLAVGNGPEGTGWRIAVEDPLHDGGPVAVLQLHDLACTTSSIRLRRWRSGDAEVHHIIDPRTGRPGGAGLVAVTVVGPDPAEAEVWSKALFLRGQHDIAGAAAQHGLAALWIDSDGRLHSTAGADAVIIWRADAAD